jgi:hypothetical protein
MSKSFDMELFLVSVLSGSQATRRRHLKQSAAIQNAIFQRWKLANPWTWRVKQLLWFMNNALIGRSPATRYRYWLTIKLIALKLEKKFHRCSHP